MLKFWTNRVNKGSSHNFSHDLHDFLRKGKYNAVKNLWRFRSSNVNSLLKVREMLQNFCGCSVTCYLLHTALHWHNKGATLQVKKSIFANHHISHHHFITKLSPCSYNTPRCLRHKKCTRLMYLFQKSCGYYWLIVRTCSFLYFPFWDVQKCHQKTCSIFYCTIKTVYSSKGYRITLLMQV